MQTKLTNIQSSTIVNIADIKYAVYHNKGKTWFHRLDHQCDKSTVEYAASQLHTFINETAKLPEKGV